jgi:hypothetical protein
MSERRRLHSVPEIADLLNAQIVSLCEQLLPAGRRDGQEWRVGSIAGEPGQSLGVHLSGARRGVWRDFAGPPDHQGDALDLVAQVRFGGNKSEALRWARAWLGLSEHNPAGFGSVPAQRPERPEHAERDREGKRQKAVNMWLSGQPIEGTPVEAYLAARGIELAALGRVPRALRFIPNAWCQEAEGPLPAMVAAITRRGHHVATHRTYLAEERGTWAKAPLRKAKKVLGAYAGGVISLVRGPSAKPLAQAPDDDQVAIAEGIEDALTVALHEPTLRCLACISLSNMAAVELPEHLTDLVLVFDRDGENPQARAARERAVRGFLEQGRSVREVRPAEGHKDFNAWHQALRERDKGKEQAA